MSRRPQKFLFFNIFLHSRDDLSLLVDDDASIIVWIVTCDKSRQMSLSQDFIIALSVFGFLPENHHGTSTRCERELLPWIINKLITCTRRRKYLLRLLLSIIQQGDGNVVFQEGKTDFLLAQFRNYKFPIKMW
jgi:hypothetical protein